MMSLQGHFHFSHNILYETLASETGSLALKLYCTEWLSFKVEMGFSRQFLYFVKIKQCLIASPQLFCLAVIKRSVGGGGDKGTCKGLVRCA